MSLAPCVLSSLEHIWRLFYCKLRQTSRLAFIWMVCVFGVCFSNSQTYLEELFAFSFKPSCRTGPWTCSNQKRGWLVVHSQFKVSCASGPLIVKTSTTPATQCKTCRHWWIHCGSGTIYSMLSCSVIAYFYLAVFCPIIPSSIQVLLITLSCQLFCSVTMESLSGIVSFGLRILPLTICVQFSAKQMEITYVNLCLSREDQIQIWAKIKPVNPCGNSKTGEKLVQNWTHFNEKYTRYAVLGSHVAWGVCTTVCICNIIGIGSRSFSGAKILRIKCMSFRPTVFAHIVGPASTTDLFLSADWAPSVAERFFWFPFVCAYIASIKSQIYK